MINKSAFHRIIFFIAISVSYISYKVVYQAFYEKTQTAEEKEVKLVSEIIEMQEVKYKFLEESSREAPYSAYLENTTIEAQQENPYFGASKKAKRSSKVDFRNPNYVVKKGFTPSESSSPNNSMITTADVPINSEDYTNVVNNNVIITGGAGDGSIVMSSGSDDEQITVVDNTSLSLNILSTSESHATTGNGIQGSISSSSGIGSARVGISTTPSGKPSNPTVQAPPPPPPPPVPLDTNSVIFILIGAATGVFVLLKDAKKGSKQTA